MRIGNPGGGVVLLLLTLLFSTAKAQLQDDGGYVMRWSSTGGGWRAMFACIGYGNAFQQAGLFRNGKSRFSGIAVNSGAAWYATQLFYSDVFYQKTIDGSPDELYDFTVQWMNDYKDLLDMVTNATASLDDLTNTSDLNVDGIDNTDQDSDAATYLDEFYQIFDGVGGDWALFIQEMLQAGAVGYGHPGSLVDLNCHRDQRVLPLNQTDLLVQTALAPTARIRNTTALEEDEPSGANQTAMGALGAGLDALFNPPDDELVYLGPVGTSDVYKVALSSAYIVNETFNGFQFSTFDTGDSSNLNSYLGTTSSQFGFSDWTDFGLYEDAASMDSSPVISDWEVPDGSTTIMRRPFSAQRGGPPGGGGMGPPGGGGMGPPPGQGGGGGGQGPPPGQGGGGGGQGPPQGGGQGGGGGQGPPPQGGGQGGGGGQGPPPQNRRLQGGQGGGGGGQGPPPGQGGGGGGPPGGGFGGGPPGGTTGRNRGATITQVASISSAAVGTASPAIPSVYAQAFSAPRSNLDTLTQKVAFDTATGILYGTPVIDNVAVCGQWPDECQQSDGWFIDGGFADNPSFAINIAQYHQEGGDISKPMKIVLTNTNQEFNSTYNLAQLKQYYAVDFNEGIAPGDYIWIPTAQIPRRSAQVFAESMDEETLLSIQEPFDDSNMTSCILTGTTIDNPAFGIRAGQQVEVLLLNLNEPITTFIAGQTIIEDTTEPLARMTRHIAANQQLIQRVQDFFYPNGVPEDPTEAPEETIVTGDEGAGETIETSETTETSGTAGTGGEGETTDSSATDEGQATDNGDSESTTVAATSRAATCFQNFAGLTLALLSIAISA